MAAIGFRGDAEQLAFVGAFDPVAHHHLVAIGETLIEESLGLFRQQGDRWGIARAFIVLGDRNLFAGAVERAESRFRTGLEIALDPSGSLGYGGNLADARVRLGEEAFAKAWQRGRTMPLGQAMDEVAGDDA